MVKQQVVKQKVVRQEVDKRVATWRVLGAAWVTALCTLSPVASAVPVTPVVVAGSTTAAAFTLGTVPGDFSLGIQVDALAASTAESASNGVSPLTDTTDGSASATVDTTDINLSSVGSRSFAGTGADGSPAPPAPLRDVTNSSFGAFGATLSTLDLAPADTAEVDLTLNFDGTITYRDDGSAGINVESVDANLDPILIPDISGSVSVLMDLSDLTTVPLNFDGTPDLSGLTFVPLFNGSLTLESSGAGAPLLTAVGDFGLLDYTILPGCDAFFCQVDVLMSRTFSDVQSLGLGDTFDLGLMVFTDAQTSRAPGRSIDMDFMNTASVLVDIATTSVPAPVTGLLMLTGLVMLRVRRRQFWGRGKVPG